MCRLGDQARRDHHGWMVDHTGRRGYDSDLTDAQWELVEPLLPPERGGREFGRPLTHPRREIVNAILYLAGRCSWRQLPGDLPPWATVYDYFATWKADGNRWVSEVLVPSDGRCLCLVRPTRSRRCATPATPPACTHRYACVLRKSGRAVRPPPAGLADPPRRRETTGLEKESSCHAPQ